MMPTDTQANLPVGLEAPVGCDEAEAGRAERIGGRQDDAPMVETAGVGGAGGPADGEVPLEEVRI